MSSALDTLTPLEREAFERGDKAVVEAVLRQRARRLALERDGLASVRRQPRGFGRELLDGAIAYSEAVIERLERELDELAAAAGITVLKLV